MKCLPSSKVAAANGAVLHDWHAETLAIRAFNHFLLEECERILAGDSDASAWVRRRDANEIGPSSFQSFAVRDDVRIHLYCSEAPCGDASMELVMAAQGDATPWLTPSRESPACGSSEAPVLPGRAYFSELGVVRRKPGKLKKHFLPETETAVSNAYYSVSSNDLFKTPLNAPQKTQPEAMPSLL